MHLLFTFIYNFYIYASNLSYNAIPVILPYFTESCSAIFRILNISLYFICLRVTISHSANSRMLLFAVSCVAPVELGGNKVQRTTCLNLFYRSSVFIWSTSILILKSGCM